MNKEDLVAIIREEYGLSYRESDRLLDTILNSIRDELDAGGKVFLRNFGKFEMKTFKSKKIWDISTEKIRRLPKRRKVQFTPSKNIFKVF